MEEPQDQEQRRTSPDEEEAQVEDATAPTPEELAVPAEDAPELLEHSARDLEADAIPPETPPAEERHRAVVIEYVGDTDAISEGELEEVGEVSPALEPAALARKIAVELKHIETEVRSLVEAQDPRRKRKLSGTRRWLELEEDIINWRYSSRYDEPTLVRLQSLVARRHSLFRRLKYLAGTRPTWNT